MSFKDIIVTEEAIKFFKKMPLFQFFDKSVLKDITNDLTIEFYPRDTVILKQDGPPSDSLRIIKKGKVKVFMEENGKEVLIDYRVEGDTFGFLSLIRKERQETTVIAIDDTVCYLLNKEKGLKLLETNPVFTGYFLKSHLSRYIHRAHKGIHHKSLSGSDENSFLFTTQAGDIATKEVVTVTEDETIQNAAQIMVENKISSLIILGEKNLPIGIVTDKDLRGKVVAKGRDINEPIKNIMSLPHIRVDDKDYCVEAILKMIRYNIHYILVVKNGDLDGIITNHDLVLLLQRKSLRRKKSEPMWE